ncbi:MAG: hypothetical protein MHPSP_001330, partial [Paramarteilia canceri]
SMQQDTIDLERHDLMIEKQSRWIRKDNTTMKSCGLSTNNSVLLFIPKIITIYIIMPNLKYCTLEIDGSLKVQKIIAGIADKLEMKHHWSEWGFVVPMENQDFKTMQEIRRSISSSEEKEKSAMYWASQTKDALDMALHDLESMVNVGVSIKDQVNKNVTLKDVKNDPKLAKFQKNKTIMKATTDGIYLNIFDKSNDILTSSFYIPDTSISMEVQTKKKNNIKQKKYHLIVKESKISVNLIFETSDDLIDFMIGIKTHAARSHASAHHYIPEYGDRIVKILIDMEAGDYPTINTENDIKKNITAKQYLPAHFLAETSKSAVEKIFFLYLFFSKDTDINYLLELLVSLACYTNKFNSLTMITDGLWESLDSSIIINKSQNNTNGLTIKKLVNKKNDESVEFSITIDSGFIKLDIDSPPDSIKTDITSAILPLSCLHSWVLTAGMGIYAKIRINPEVKFEKFRKLMEIAKTDKKIIDLGKNAPSNRSRLNQSYFYSSSPDGSAENYTLLVKIVRKGYSPHHGHEFLYKSSLRNSKAVANSDLEAKLMPVLDKGIKYRHTMDYNFMNFVE